MTNVRPGVIADFGYDGGVVGFEILQASKVVEQAGEWSQGIRATQMGKPTGRMELLAKAT